MKRSRSATVLAALIASGAVLATDDRGQAMLDLATCHGATLSTEQLSAEREGAGRVDDMAKVFASLDDEEIFRTSEFQGFWTPTRETAVAGLPVQYFGGSGFGIFEGVNVILTADFDDVRTTLSRERSIDYGDCRAEGLLRVCTREIAPGFSRMIMSHPTDPAERTVLICVEGVS